MSERRVLQPDVRVEAAGVELLCPSLRGVVTVSAPGELVDGTRGAGVPDVGFQTLLQETGVREHVTVELAELEHLGRGVADDGRGAGDHLQVDVPAPVAGVGQVVLDVGVDGVWTWHVGADLGGGGTGRAGGTRRYLLPGDTGRPVAIEPDGAEGNRGLVGYLGKRVIKVLLFKVLEIGGAWAAEQMARTWEDAKRPHRLRWVTARDIGDPLTDVPTLTAAQLGTLGNERALLLIHGTASRTDSCFRSMPPAVVHELADHYGGRVLAFDHPTISYDPVANVEWLAKQLPGGIKPTFDVISHSRGGLVSRLLFERSDLIDSSQFNSAVLVAAPNEGTTLASPAKLGALLNSLTNVVGAVPANPVGDVLEVVLTVVKHLAVGALGGLDGIASMDPEMTWLNTNLPDSAQFLPKYRAVGSDYEPPKGAALARIARDLATDAIFGNAGNDLVVPTNGTDLYGKVAPSVRFPRAAGVDHSGYWAMAKVTDQILTWLATRSGSTEEARTR
jgi:hypothetical protein